MGVLEEVTDGDGTRDKGEADQGPRTAFADDDGDGQQNRPGITPEDHERIPGRESAEFAVAVLQRVPSESPRASDVEEALAVVNLTGEFDGGFARRIVIREEDVRFVDIDLRDLAAQEDNLGGLLTVDAAHEEYAAELSFERLEPIPGNPRCGQGQPPEEADDQ